MENTELDHSLVLPEIKKILDDMVALYNSDATDLYLKIFSDVEGSDRSVRYESFADRGELFKSIEANCPPGLSLEKGD